MCALSRTKYGVDYWVERNTYSSSLCEANYMRYPGRWWFLQYNWHFFQLSISIKQHIFQKKIWKDFLNIQILREIIWTWSSFYCLNGIITFRKKLNLSYFSKSLFISIYGFFYEGFLIYDLIKYWKIIYKYLFMFLFNLVINACVINCDIFGRYILSLTNNKSFKTRTMVRTKKS